jgi:hypothetical protein
VGEERQGERRDAQHLRWDHCTPNEGVWDGNMHERHAVDVTCGSIGKETEEVNLFSGHLMTMMIMSRRIQLILKLFHVSFRAGNQDIQHTRNN